MQRPAIILGILLILGTACGRSRPTVGESLAASVIKIRCLAWRETPATELLPPDTVAEQVSSGSAVVISRDGYAVTALHCVLDHEAGRFFAIEVDAGAGWEPAKVVDTNPVCDTALIVCTMHRHWSPARIAREPVRIGDSVYAAGFPFGILGRSVSAGIVSQVHAHLPGEPDSYIQTDAAMNPGSSGGGLFNARGDLVGVLDAIVNPGGRFFCGLGYAEPIAGLLPMLKRQHLQP